MENIGDTSIRTKFLIHPENNFKLCFDIIGFLLIVYQTFTLPMYICFNFEVSSLKFLDYFSDMFFLVDVLLNFNTGFYNYGTLIMERSRIIKNYSRGWFCFDLISSLPYTFIFDSLEQSITISNKLQNAPKLIRIFRIVRFIKIMRLIKLVKLSSIYLKMEDYFSGERVLGLFIYTRTMLIFVTILHFLTCMFFVISSGEFQNNYKSILSMNELAVAGISQQYLTILYYMLTTFYTIGYGDYRPQSTTERIFALFVMLLNYGLYCIIISTIRNLVQKSITIEEDLKVKLKNTKQFFKEKNLPTELTNKVTKYLEFMYTEKSNRRTDIKDIFSLLNEKLGEELRIEINRKMLCSIPFLRNSNYDVLINKLCMKIYEEIVSPHELIITEGDVSSKRMFFIDKGNVLLFNNATTIILKELGPQDYFGEIGFFTLPPNKEPRAASAITKTFCSVNFILQPEILVLIYECVGDLRAKNEILELFQNSNPEYLLEKLGVRCFYCYERHLIKDSKEKEIDYLERIKSLNNLNEFKSRNLKHFKKLSLYKEKRENNTRRKAFKTNTK